MILRRPRPGQPGRNKGVAASAHGDLMRGLPSVCHRTSVIELCKARYSFH